MKQFYCNEINVSLSKMAMMSKHKLTGIHTRQNKTYCKLDGKTMLTKEARAWLLSRYTFIVIYILGFVLEY